MLFKYINIFLKEKNIYCSAMVMNNPIVFLGFEPSFLQICQWLCQIDVPTFMGQETVYPDLSMYLYS